MVEITQRELEWELFEVQVKNHIKNYTVPQYGDKGKDLATKRTSQQLMEAIERYTNRFSSNARGINESQRDLLKIAHYACMAWHKVLEG